MSIQTRYDIRVTCDSCGTVADIEKWAPGQVYGIVDGRGVAPELAQIGWKVISKRKTGVETLCPACAE